MGGRMCKIGADDSDDEVYDPRIRDDTEDDLVKQSKLTELFGATNADGSGQIEYSAFLVGFALDNTALTQKLFNLFDEDHSGSLDYRDFLKALDRYRRMAYEERLAWCFKVYDADDSGTISKDELSR